MDRLWPRGLTKKESAALDVWLKDVAPSHELRKWYHAHPSQWSKYNKQLPGRTEQQMPPDAALQQLHDTGPQEARFGDAVVCVQEPGAKSRPGAETGRRWRTQAAHGLGAHPRCCHQAQARCAAEIGYMILRPEAQPAHPENAFVSAWEAVARAEKTRSAKYHLVRQPDHARVSGEIAQHFAIAGAPPVDDDIVRGISSAR